MIAGCSTDKESFYSHLTGILTSANKEDIVPLMDDFNAQVETDNTKLEKTMGIHGVGQMNENAELFTEFCSNNNLVIGGIPFPHRNIYKVTWISSNHTTKNQTDHIAIGGRLRGSLLDVKNRRGADVTIIYW